MTSLFLLSLWRSPITMPENSRFLAGGGGTLGPLAELDAAPITVVDLLDATGACLKKKLRYMFWYL